MQDWIGLLLDEFEGTRMTQETTMCWRMILEYTTYDVGINIDGELGTI